jgi:hypothetical protein
MWSELAKTEDIYVVSVSQIEPIDTSAASRMYAPNTQVYLLSHQEMESLHAQGFEAFLELFHSRTDRPLWRYVEEVPFFQIGKSDRYFTVDTKAMITISDAWRYLEVSFMKNFFDSWPLRTQSFSTLCTPQDNTEKFRFVGFLESDLKKLAIPKYSQIVVERDLSLSKHRKIVWRHYIPHLLHPGKTRKKPLSRPASAT